MSAKYPFLILTLDAASLWAAVQKQPEQNYSVSLNKDGWRLSCSFSPQRGSALFDQLCFALGREPASCPETFLQDKLLYLDCKTLIRRKGGDSCLAALLKHGFSVTWDRPEADEPHCVRYCAFDKSASMARSCVISFLDESLHEQMEARLLLDMDLAHAGPEGGPLPLSLSRYYSYRGLYLSSSMRMEDLPLSEHTVIVLPDKKCPLPPERLLAADPAGKTEEGKMIYDFHVAEKDPLSEPLLANAFDGEGFITPDLAARLNETLGTPEATSYQIRMPFAKGMAHTVDVRGLFTTLLQETGTAVSFDDLFVTDLFGIKRRLSEAKLILTESMFKCAGWLSACAGPGTDCMAQYFSAFRKYRHALYLVRTDSAFHRAEITTLNYQFFGTLDLTQGELLDLAQEQLNKVNSLLGGGPALETFLAVPEEDEPFWKQALRKRPELAREPYVARQLGMAVRSTRIRTMQAELDVPGFVKLLSGDLTALAAHLTSLLSAEDPSLPLSGLKDRLQREALAPNELYLPGVQAVTKGQPCVLLRNPHLSRNEECLLFAACPEEDSLRQRFFGHLTGVVMTAQNSSAPMILGGADFDGDLVRVLTGGPVVEAVRRSVYFEDGSRRLPVILIPSEKAQKKPVPERVDVSTVLQSFDNQIGLLSNAAFSIGLGEYWPAKGADGGAAIGCCEKCTVFTGLEIDAAKSGLRPDLSPVRKKKADLRGGSRSLRGFSYFKDLRDRLGHYRTADRLITPQFDENGEISLYQFSFPRQSRSAGLNKLLVRLHPADYTDAPINLLPYYVASYLYKADQNKAGSGAAKPGEDGGSSKQPVLLFPADSFKDKEKKKAAREILSALRRVERLDAAIGRDLRERDEDRNQYLNRVRSILHAQYGDADAPLEASEQTLSSVLEAVLAELSEPFADGLTGRMDYDILRGMLRTVCGEEGSGRGGWHLTPPAARSRVLEDLFPALSETSLQLLCDFREKGYLILPLLLRHLLSLEGRESYLAAALPEEHSELREGFAARLYGFFRAERLLGLSDSVRRRDLPEQALDALTALFEGDMDALARCVYGLDDGRFFWENLPPALLERYL